MSRGNPLLLASVLILLPLAASQPVSEADLGLEDPLADEVITSRAGNQSGDGRFPYADITRVWLAKETVDDFEIGVQTQAWMTAAGGTPNDENRVTRIFFQVKDVEFVAARLDECDGGFILKARPVGAPEDAFDGIACLEGSIDAAAAIITMRVPKSVIVDHVAAPFRAGDTIAALYAEVTDRSTGDIATSLTGVPTVYDRIPDSGTADSYEIQYGLQASGNIELFTANPVRLTNGEAGSVVYSVTVRNQAAEPVDLVLSSHDIPDTWITNHATTMTLASASEATIPVVLTTTSAHRHGGQKVWQLRAEATTTSDQATLDLGLAYPTIPQPAGHHPTIYFHSAPGDALSRPGPWMNNAVTDPDPSASDEPYPGLGGASSSGGEATWRFPLRPGLGLGLDFDLARVATFQSELESAQPLRAVIIDARLLKCPASATTSDACLASGLVLASGTQDLGSIDAATPVAVAVEMIVAAEADFLAFEKGANLLFALGLRSQTPILPQTITLAMVGSTLELPLFDYHDAVDVAFLSDASVSLALRGHSSRQANPGDTIVFDVTLVNSAETARTFAPRIASQYAAWAYWNTDSLIQVEAGSSWTGQFVVRVPGDAIIGENVEFFLLLGATDGSATELLQRVAVAVVADDVPDDAALVQSVAAKKSPGMPVMALLVGLAAWTASRRRGG